MLFSDNQLTDEQTEKIHNPFSARFTCDFHRGNIEQVSGPIRDITGYQCGYFIKGGIRAFMDIIPVEDQLSLLKLYLELCEIHSQRIKIPKKSLLLNIRQLDGNWIQAEIRILKLEFNTDVPLMGVSGTVQLQYDPGMAKPGPASNDYAPSQDLPDDYNPDLPVLQESISKREKQVLYLIAHGYSSKMVADELSISIHTATTHRTNLLDKFQAKNTAELVLMASKTFWL